MKLTKTLITFCLFITSFSSGYSQVEKGNILITPTFGMPYLDLFGHDLDIFDAGLGGVEMRYRTFYDEDNLRVKLRGVYGFKVDYLLRDKIGLGIDFMYNSAEITFNRDSIVGQEIVKEVNYQEKMSRIRVALRFNFHFYSNEHVSVYTGANLGFRKRNFSYESDDPNYKPVLEDQYGFGNSLGLDYFPISLPSMSGLPVHGKIAIGMHYFPNSFLGFNLEAALGGPPIIVGLTVKI